MTFMEMNALVILFPGTFMHLIHKDGASGILIFDFMILVCFFM